MTVLWCPEVVLAHPHPTGRVVVFLKSSTSHIPQYPVLTKNEFPWYWGCGSCRRICFLQIYFFSVRNRCQFHFQRHESLYDMTRNRSLRDIIEYRWKVTLWSWDLGHHSHFPLAHYVTTVHRKGGKLEANLEKYVVYIRLFLFLLSRLFLRYFFFLFARTTFQTLITPWKKSSHEEAIETRSKY